jgi:hypothetical protein
MMDIAICPATWGRYGCRKIVLIVIALLFAACDLDENDDSKWVGYDLRGTWERTEATFWPEGQTTTSERGRIVLTYDTITISGPVSHLQDFTRNVAL